MRSESRTGRTYIPKIIGNNNVIVETQSKKKLRDFCATSNLKTANIFFR